MHEANVVPVNDINALNEASRRAWAPIAAHQGDDMGEQQLHTVLIDPAAERLLGARPGDEGLESACGNGSFARRPARAGPGGGASTAC